MSVIVLHNEYPVARKEHACDWCGRTIRPGERYNRARCVGDCGPYVFRSCAHCQAMWRSTNIDEFADSDFGVGADDFAEYEPVDVRELRLKALWRMKWTRRDGTLHPVPESEPTGEKR